MKPEKEARLLRLLAAALARDLAMPYQRLAAEVGVSRRTLYRIAPTRELLFERLRQEAIAANGEALAAAGLAAAPFRQALKRLTDEFVTNAALYEFWQADTWGKTVFPTAGSASDVELASYHQQMARFFRGAQQAGHVRADVPLDWLLASYDALLVAATGCLRRETGSAVELAGLLVDMFAKGVGAPDEVARMASADAHGRAQSRALTAPVALGG